MNYFGFGCYKYRDVFETAKSASDFVSADSKVFYYEKGQLTGGIGSVSCCCFL